ncbi:DUF4864 domain-containing protein [Noviherbaspirillum aridicola]|uniref:DUF4864 domain-containing protein n=1 Tax=Noviherbaspirillum aridicola TaxID=2849687 RepID=UPI001C7FEAF0|nr:DUF4864 domain-containing protein [Noviherbaspirillum aridicola]
MKRWLATAGLLIGLCGYWTPAAAIDALTTGDAIAIHQAVRTQMDALSNDDADGAFRLTTQEKRHLIGSPDNFLRMIKEEYNPLYRHRGVIFSSPEVVDGDAVQLVRVTDGAGKVWIAVFWMLQEDDGNWKIDGCHLLGTNTLSI